MTILYTPNPVEEAYALYLLRSVFHRDYSATDFLLEGRNAVPFFTLSGQDRLILRNIWNVADPTNVGTLTDISQFHTCLRLIALAQSGILGEALAVAFRQYAAETSPVTVMVACLQATASTEGIPLPVFAGITMPQGSTLQLIYVESRRARVLPGRSVSTDSHSQMFHNYQTGQVDSQDSDKTLRTSNLSRSLQQDELRAFEASTDANVGLGSTPQPLQFTSTVIASDVSMGPGSGPTSREQLSAFATFPPPQIEKSMHVDFFEPQATMVSAPAAVEDEEDFGEFASTEPTGWDALDALVDVQDAPLPKLGSFVDPIDEEEKLDAGATEMFQTDKLTSQRTSTTRKDDIVWNEHATGQGAADAESILPSLRGPSTEGVNLSLGQMQDQAHVIEAHDDIEDDFGDFVDHPLTANDQSPEQIEPPTNLSGWDALDALADNDLQSAVGMSTESHNASAVGMSTESHSASATATSEEVGTSNAAIGKELVFGTDMQDSSVPFESRLPRDNETFATSSAGSEPGKIQNETPSLFYDGTVVPEGDNCHRNSAVPNTCETESDGVEEGGILRCTSMPEHSCPASVTSTNGPLSLGRSISMPTATGGWDAFDSINRAQDAPLPPLTGLAANVDGSNPSDTAASPFVTTMEENLGDADNSMPVDPSQQTPLAFGTFGIESDMKPELTTDDFVTESSDFFSATNVTSAPDTDMFAPDAKADGEPLVDCHGYIESMNAPSTGAVDPFSAFDHLVESKPSENTALGNEFIETNMVAVSIPSTDDEFDEDFGEFIEGGVEASNHNEQLDAAHAPTPHQNVSNHVDERCADGMPLALGANQTMGENSVNQNIPGLGLIEPNDSCFSDDDFGDFEEFEPSSVDGNLSRVIGDAAVVTSITAAHDDNYTQIQAKSDQALVSPSDPILPPEVQPDEFDDSFGDFAEFQEVSKEDTSDMLVEKPSDEILDLRAKVISRSLKLPESLLVRSNTGEGERIDFADCFDGNIGVDQPLDDQKRSRIHRCILLLELLSNSHAKLASTYWDEAMNVILDELKKVNLILNEAASISAEKYAVLAGRLEILTHAAGEFVRVSRCIIATVGDLLLLDASAVLTGDTLASSWCSLSISKKALEIEQQWANLERQARSMRLTDKQNMPHRLETLVEMRCKCDDAKLPLCEFTLRALVVSKVTTMSTVVWQGDKYMAFVANFLCHLCPFYALAP